LGIGLSHASHPISSIGRTEKLNLDAPCGLGRISPEEEAPYVKYIVLLVFLELEVCLVDGNNFMICKVASASHDKVPLTGSQERPDGMERETTSEATGSTSERRSRDLESFWRRSLHELSQSSSV